MPVSKAQLRATANYELKKYDKVLLRMDKGKKDMIQAYANDKGESLNGYIMKAIAERMERDGYILAAEKSEKISL